MFIDSVLFVIIHHIIEAMKVLTHHSTSQMIWTNTYSIKFHKGKNNVNYFLQRYQLHLVITIYWCDVNITLHKFIYDDSKLDHCL